jgi:hypothetical protein
VPGSDQAESSDWINVLNAQEVLLEDTGDIHLEWHHTHRPSPISFETSQNQRLIILASDVNTLEDGPLLPVLSFLPGVLV